MSNPSFPRTLNSARRALTMLCPRSSRAPLSLLSLAACLVPASSALAAPPTKPAKSTPAARATAPAGATMDAELKAALAAAPGASQWPNSNYARLLDIGNVTVKPDGTILAKYRISYKLFNERARELAEVNLPYNSSYQEVRVLSARTIKKDGTIVERKNPEEKKTSPHPADQQKNKTTT